MIDKIYKWEYFWESLCSEISNIESEYNLEYLNCGKPWLVNLINWTEKTNKQNYLSEIKSYNLYDFLEIDYFEYKFYFDWCIIKDEVHYYLRNSPSNFNDMIRKIYSLFDFLLSYNSLKECPGDSNNELYYVESDQKIYLECKISTKLYDLNLNEVKNIRVNYCSVYLLILHNLLRVRSD